MKKWGFLLSAVFFCSCTHSVHLVNFSDQRPYKRLTDGKQISAHTEQFSVLGFNGDTNYVELAYQKLQSQCPQGKVTAITTKYYTDHGFFSWTNHLEMNGYCIN